MELRRLLALIRQRLVLLVLIVIAGLVGSYAATSQTALYKATTTIYVGQPSTNLSADLQTGQELLATTFAVIIPTPTVAQAAIQDTRVDRNVGEVVAATKATPLTGTNLINVSVSDPDPVVAQAVANGMAKAFVAEAEKIAPLITATGQTSGTPPASVTQPASLPLVPLASGLRRNIILGGLAGALVGIGLILLLDYVDLSARTPNDLERQVGLPVLGIIPLQTQIAEGAGVAGVAPERVMLMVSEDA